MKSKNIILLISLFLNLTLLMYFVYTNHNNSKNKNTSFKTVFDTQSKVCSPEK